MFRQGANFISKLNHMSYIVFARKWRPKNFDEMIGQSHITTTLKNAIEQGTIAHAYLFCGPRGTGKTSTARLLAKALNCEEGPTATPCNKCNSCKEISELKSFDIIEIDAASNRGIDDIRALREGVRFKPQYSRYKVYIVDEVHMLTPEAFNALLKTLEEPPEHVKFIFATTAVHKVPPTILSRCQRFDFKRISVQDIISKLEKITNAEKIKADKQALIIIARAASGSMRDAESILDQLNSFTKGKITIESVNSVLGLIPYQALNEFTECIISKDTKSALNLIEKAVAEGKDEYQFLLNLIEYFRNILIAQQGEDLQKLMDLSEEESQAISKQTQSFTVEDVLYILYTLINSASSVRYSPSARIPLDMVAVKLTRRESIISLADILKRIAALEKRISENSERPDDFARQPPVNNNETPQARVSDEPKGQQQQEKGQQGIDLYKLREIWPQVIKKVKLERIYLASCLEEAEIMELKDNTLTIGYAKNNKFQKAVLEKAENKKLIEDTIAGILGASVILETTASDKVRTIQKDSNDAKDSQQNNIPTEALRKDTIKKVLSDPIIQSALDIFDGNIMRFM